MPEEYVARRNTLHAEGMSMKNAKKKAAVEYWYKHHRAVTKGEKRRKR